MVLINPIWSSRDLQQACKDLAKIVNIRESLQESYKNGVIL